MIAPQEPEVSASVFKRIKIRMLTTGEFDNNDFHLLSSNQKYWVNETKKTLRDLSE